MLCQGFPCCEWRVSTSLCTVLPAKACHVLLIPVDVHTGPSASYNRDSSLPYGDSGCLPCTTAAMSGSLSLLHLVFLGLPATYLRPIGIKHPNRALWTTLAVQEGP